MLGEVVRRQGWLVGLVALVGCASVGESDADGQSDADGALSIEPASSVLTVVDGSFAEQPLRVFREGAGGTRTDVTAQVAFEVLDPRLGQVRDAVFVASGLAGGLARVQASLGERTADATVDVQLRWTTVDESAPPDAPDRFDAAEPDGGELHLAYPPDGVLVPPNLDELEVHWRGDPAATLYEITIASDFASTRLYTAGHAANDGGFALLGSASWTLIERSLRGVDTEISLRALIPGPPDRVITAAPSSIRLAESDIAGAIYYWASTTTDGAPAGIYRHDWGAELAPAEPYFTQAQSAGGRCVGCHALSRDGAKMAVTHDGGPGVGAILDVATRAEMLAVDDGVRWTHTAWSPDAAYLVSELDGQLVLRDGDTGSQIATIGTAPGYATYPDFSPRGDAIVYATRDPHRVIVQPFDPATAQFGAPRSLATGPVKDSYPAWAPDGQWILYNQDGPGGNELWVITADDSLPPIELGRADRADPLHNAWPRWSPFVQQTGEGEALYWFTFSSDRDFGVRLARGERTQLWMAAFAPARAARGEDPSEPAFRLPFQNLTGTNHIAQWAEAIVDVE